MANNDRRLICPDCGRKTVFFRIGRTVESYGTTTNEDRYYCSRRACDFTCYKSDQATETDKQNMFRLATLNPEYVGVLRGYGEPVQILCKINKKQEVEADWNTGDAAGAWDGGGMA